MDGDEALLSFDFSPDVRHSLTIDEIERVDDSLSFDVSVRVHRFTAHPAAMAGMDAFRSWASGLRTLHDTLIGEAVLEADMLTLHMEGDGRGRISLGGEVRSVPFPSWGDASLRFTMPGVDQTFLPPAIAAVDRLLSLQPAVEDD